MRQPPPVARVPPASRASRASSLLDRLRPDRRGRWVLAFVLLGLLARCVRYGLHFPLWEDECFLCVNFLRAGFEGTATYESLTGPLRYRQVAPPLFLFAELAAVKAFGFGEWPLRLVPLVCSVASLLLFTRLAGRLLTGRAATLAVGLYAVAYPGIRYAAEAKPYASDGLVALVLLSLAVQWFQTGRTRWLWVAAAFAPVAIGLSYPAVFVLGGVSLAVLAELWRRRGEEEVRTPTGPAAAWTAFNVATAAAFGVLLLTAAKAQADNDLDFMRTYWSDDFPPLAKPWRLPGWLAAAHTSELFAWPIGGARGASVLTAVLVAAGLPWLIRGPRAAGMKPIGRTSWFLPALLLGPFAVHLVAAALHRYPYGGHVKFSMHLGPAVCLLAGAGGAALSGAVARLMTARPRFEPRLAAVLLCGVAAVALGGIARDVAAPHKNPADARQRSFARWFFRDAALEGPVELVTGPDGSNGEPFSPDTWTELSWAAMFLCNRAIQSADVPQAGDNGAAGAGPLQVPADRFRCVIYRDGTKPFDSSARSAWLSEMTVDHHLAARDRFPLTRYTRRGQWVRTDWVETYRFAPKEPGPARTAAADDTAWARY